MIAFLKRVFIPGGGHLDKLVADHAASVANRFNVERDGIAFTFEEHNSGLTYVYATRCTKPYSRATFQVENKAEACAWRKDGVVPLGETADLLRQLKAGTWPKSHSVDDIF